MDREHMPATTAAIQHSLLTNCTATGFTVPCDHGTVIEYGQISPVIYMY